MEKENTEQSFAFELLKEQAKTNKRQCIIIMILILAFLISNMAWLWVFQSYDYQSTSTITVDGKDSPAIYQEQNGEVHIDGESNQANNDKP